MYHQVSRRGGVVLGLLVLGFFSVAWAQAPESLFSREGVIGKNLDRTEGIIVVNDLVYDLSPDVHVYVYDRTIKDPQALRAATRLKDGRVLRAGMHIGYMVAGEAGGKRGTLTEAWILPPGSLPARDKGVKSAGQPATTGTGKAQTTR
jgi:class 3 adenylate cyclase